MGVSAARGCYAAKPWRLILAKIEWKWYLSEGGVESGRRWVQMKWAAESK